MNKKEFQIDLKSLDLHCKNKALLKLLFYDFITTKTDKYDGYLILNKNQNLLKPEILKIFKNVTELQIYCGEYPIALESLLPLITQNNIKKVDIYGGNWIASVQSGSSFSEKFRLEEIIITWLWID